MAWRPTENCSSPSSSTRVSRRRHRHPLPRAPSAGLAAAPATSTTPARDVAAVAAALAASHEAHRRTPVLRTVPSGWRNNPSQLHIRDYDSPVGELRVGYSLHRDRRFEVNGEALAGVAVVSVASDQVVLLVDGVRQNVLGAHRR